MANTGTLLIVGLAIVGIYGYTQGWFNGILGGASGSYSPRGGYIPPGSSHIYRPHGPGPYGPHRGVVGGDPVADAPYVNPGTNIGYGDDGGYGSEYGFDANVAHISIA